MKQSQNLDLLIQVMVGYALYLWVPFLLSSLGLDVSILPIAVAYYSILSAWRSRYRFLAFILITSAVLLSFLSFVKLGSVTFSSFHEVITKQYTVTFLYTMLLLPFVFFSWMADFYSLPYELVKLSKIKVFYFAMPILIKRELIKRRFNAIADCLFSRGVEVHGLTRIKTVFQWAIPLLVTTIQEGVEAHEYNKMLETDITCLDLTHKHYIATARQKLSFIAILVVVTIRLLLWIGT